MKRHALLLSLAALVINSCASFSPSAGTGFGRTDYAVRRASPNGEEISLAQRRLQNFLQRADTHERGLLGQNPVVAVQANEIDASEVSSLVSQLATGQVGAAVAYYSIREDATTVPVKFLLLFDSRTGQLVSPEGVLVIDTPPRGAVANFGGVQAVYAGTG